MRSETCKLFTPQKGTLARVALLASAFFLSENASYAEGGCPNGQYPQQGPGWRTCVPIPGADSNQQAREQPRWKDYWGALAADINTATIGTVTAADTEDSASSSALTNCRAKGGVNCKILMTVRNSCMAMIVGAKLLNVQSAPTQDEAEKKGISVCNGKDSNCAVYYSACSLPERVN